VILKRDLGEENERVFVGMRNLELLGEGGRKDEEEKMG
jgi:hypothetical protein